MFKVIETLIDSYDPTSISHQYQKEILEKMEVWVVTIANPDRHIAIEDLSDHIQGNVVGGDPQKTQMAGILSGSDLVFCRKNVSKRARFYNSSDVVPFKAATVDLSKFLDFAFADTTNPPTDFDLFYGQQNSHYRHGVDINRNFDAPGYGSGVGVNVETNELYCGTGRASENETKMLQTIISAASDKVIRDGGEVRLLIDVHTKLLGVFGYSEKFTDSLGKKIINGITTYPMSEGTLTFLDSNKYSKDVASCEDYAKSKKVTYPMTLEISKAGSGSYPAKDPAGNPIDTSTLTTQAKEVILRTLIIAANG